jgi:hypothetical protein
MKAEASDGSDLNVRSLLKGGRPAAAAALSTQYRVGAIMGIERGEPQVLYYTVPYSMRCLTP